MADAVRISHAALLSDPASLHAEIESAFGSGPGCLGIVIVTDLPPEYPALRERMFRLAHRFASLPEPTRERYARPETSYMFGWSHGKEGLRRQKPDRMKGSFYANPLLDRPEVHEAKRAAHPEYYAGNVWPSDTPGLEDFEPTFKALGQLITAVGLAIAKACETFVAPAVPGAHTVESLIASSRSNKARLLHYYPEPPLATTAEVVANDALCGTHLDHSLLTGLCSAMYLSPAEASEPSIVPPPTDTAGLYIYPRASAGHSPAGDAVKVQIPADCLAFQTGEALSVLTGGRLAATPHFVSGNASTQASPVSRETYALFLQPDVDDVIDERGQTFGQFTKSVLGRHYAADAAREAED